jgi:hypothetical protein
MFVKNFEGLLEMLKMILPKDHTYHDVKITENDVVVDGEIIASYCEGSKHFGGEYCLVVNRCLSTKEIQILREKDFL